MNPNQDGHNYIYISKCLATQQIQVFSMLDSEPESLDFVISLHKPTKIIQGVEKRRVTRQRRRWRGQKMMQSSIV